MSDDDLTVDPGVPAPTDAPTGDQAAEAVRTPSAEVKAVVEALIFASPEPITPRQIFRLVAEEPKEDVKAAIEALRADYEDRPGLQLVEVAGGYQITTRAALHEWVRRLFHERSSQKLTIAGLETLAVIAYKQPITAIEALKVDYDSRPGLQLVEIAGGYQIVTRPQLHEWVRRLFHERSSQKLSVQGLETLAVIAYKQPITALEIGEIRGVNTSGVLSTLLERHLIKIVGRKNVVGRPFLYATTKEFLIRFGLKDLGDLPRIEDMAEALGFDPPAGLIEQATREEVLPLEEGEDTMDGEETKEGS